MFKDLLYPFLSVDIQVASTSWLCDKVFPFSRCPPRLRMVEALLRAGAGLGAGS